MPAGVRRPIQHADAQLQAFRFDWAELSGALGDLGVLLPLLAALVTLNGVSSTSVLVALGVAYILAGSYYRLPIPVQPMKAMAAVAIAQGLSGQVIIAGAWWMAALLLLLGLTGAVRWVGSLFTRPIIRGIQLGLGLLLVRSGLLLAGRSQVVLGGTEQLIRLSATHIIPVGWFLAAATALVLMLALASRRLPAAVIVVLFGLLITATISRGSTRLIGVHLGIALPVPAFPEWGDFPAALVLLVLPQLPLTLGNAVFATVDTARTYFGPSARRVTPQGLLATMSLSNMVAALLGGVPVCHGSSGLTAHYRLGARSGAAPLMMGLGCLLLGLFVDGNVLPILALIPYPVLGMLLVFVGVQHSLLARDLGAEEAPVAFTTAVCGFLTQNLAFGFAAGIILTHSLRLARYARAWIYR